MWGFPCLHGIRPHLHTSPPPCSGCESGRLYNTHVPTLEPYARWPTHPPGSAVLDLLPLHGCCLSLSQGRTAVHAAGGALRFTHDDVVGARVQRDKFNARRWSHAVGGGF